MILPRAATVTVTVPRAGSVMTAAGQGGTASASAAAAARRSSAGARRTAARQRRETPADSELPGSNSA
jgi:hypothetical protein